LEDQAKYQELQEWAAGGPQGTAEEGDEEQHDLWIGQVDDQATPEPAGALLRVHCSRAGAAAIAECRLRHSGQVYGTESLQAAQYG
jgi:hypothetical protein